MKKNRIAYCVAIVIALTMILLLSGCEEEPLFRLLSPTVGQSDVSLNPNISWTAADGVEKYVVKISKDEGFISVVHQQIVVGTSYYCAEALEPQTKYYLRVYTLSSDGKSLGERVDGSFTTESNQHTVDYSVTRILYDFDSIYTEELMGLFSYDTSGDALYVSVAEGVAAESTNGMKLTYGRKNEGWSSVQCTNSSEKMIWTGTKGIRFWVGGDCSDVKITVFVGNDHYQGWEATLNYNGKEGYVSIPWTAFEDMGDGDGVWELTQMTKLGFRFLGEPGDEIIIDDITIGSDSPHSDDTRYLLEKK